VLLPLARGHWLAFCAADIGIFTLVYGQFHGLWSHDLVMEMLPLFVAVRALTLALLIVVALRARARNDRAGTGERTANLFASGAVRGAGCS